jgi:hypothetical protein
LTLKEIEKIFKDFVCVILLCMFVSLLTKKNTIMKKLLLVLLVAIMAIPTFQSCKKGENDPTISLRSRKARLIGEWKLSAGTVTENYGSDIYNYTYNGSTLVVSGAANGSWTHTDAISIKKDGTFQVTIIDDNDQYVMEGNWYFLGANKDEDIKNKEVVNFNYTKITSTPSGGTPSVITMSGFLNAHPSIPDNLFPYNGMGFTWQLDQLKNKEIIVKINSSLTTSSIDSYSGTLTYVQ